MAKYIAVDGTGSPFDLAGNFAEVLIKAKLIKVYEPPQVPFKPATFGVGSLQDGKPFIVANCDRCHQKWHYEGPNPHFMEVCHCKHIEHAPVSVQAEYLQAYRSRTWEGKEPAERKFESRPAPETVSSY
ncbi:MAG: hypothetical protein WCA00_14075 [Candidatus Acidiferrales bacterium]